MTIEGNAQEATMTHEQPPKTERRAQADDPDAGAYIGSRPERATETIPGGLGPKDQRVAANATQPGPITDDREPGGHRDGPAADDDAIREAGQSG